MEAVCCHETREYGTVYICLVREIKNDTSKIAEKEIKSFSGSHVRGHDNRNVERLYLHQDSIDFVPRNVKTRFFSNLKNLEMSGCSLEEISREDLKGLEDIEVLNFSRNKLTSLPDDLFADMEKLREISFDGNRIERMSSELVVPIKETLEYADFKGNKRINDLYDVKRKVSMRTIKLEKFMKTIDSCCFPSKTRADGAFSEFSGFRTSGEFTDFTIKIREKEFRIHKMVFAAQSSFFKKMFTDDSEEVSKTFNKIKNYSDESFESVVDFFYTGKVDDSINAEEMFELASELDVRELKVICIVRILAKLNESNAVEVFNFAHQHQSEELKQKSFQVIAKIFPGLKTDWVENLDKINHLASVKAQVEALKAEIDSTIKGE